MKLLLLLLASLVVAIALAGCLKNDRDKDDDGADDVPQDQTDGNVTLPLTNLTVNAVDSDPSTLPNLFGWNPAALTAPVNTTVNLTIVSEGGATGNRFPHAFVIDELNVTVTGIQPGQSANVMFNVTAPGSYTYYCSVGNHRQQGMQGTLTVA